jgi:aspartyl protease family protein
MATGFMLRHSIALLLALASLPAAALEVALIGTFGTSAAILSVDAGAPKTVKVGQSYAGVKLISVEADRATVEAEGKRRVLVRGQTYSSKAGGAGPQSATLSAGPGGHFYADGQINGGAVRFMVDTGATSIALPVSDAIRLRIDYKSGTPMTARTAGGSASGWMISLSSVRIGEIELQNVEAMVIEQGLPVALLGNSFLSRTDMRREGQTMVLMRRF